MPDGRWSLNDLGAARPEPQPEYANEAAILDSDTAATGLALMCFLRAGHRPQHDQYGPAVRRGLEFLMRSQKLDGDLYVPENPDSDQCVWLYSHGIATIAMCDACATSQDAELREAAQKAIDFAVFAQHPTRGGWRYSPKYGSDTSVTAWLTAALVSGRHAGLDVPGEAFAKVEGWLDKAQASDGEQHLYRYNPFSPDTEAQRHGRQPSKSMTAAGLLMRGYLGWQRDDPNLVRGADFLLDNLPMMGSPSEPQRDVYYWYHATKVIHYVNGARWEAWKQQIHPLLVNTQIEEGTFAGSWDPRKPVADRWGSHAGRNYVTAMSLLTLEVGDRQPSGPSADKAPD
jgi:hypothetical protein